MKLCIAQTKPLKGEIAQNIINHIKLINLAVKEGSDIIIFPELSLTGYEPELAKKLTTSKEDIRFDEFQQICDSDQIVIGVGLPTKNEKGVCISMVIFQPDKPRTTYTKAYLHPGEEKFFATGPNSPPITLMDKTLAFAICYETSIPEHAENAYMNGANVYLASVLNTKDGVDKDINRISAIAKKYKMTAVMSNLVGKSGKYDCAGKSSCWNSEGTLIGQLDDANEGIMVYDTESELIVKKRL